MDNKLVQLKIKQRLNKLASSDYSNLECWQVAELVNKAQLQLTRRNLHGGNIYKEGDEESTTRVDDFQVLLTTAVLQGTNKDVYFETTSLPENYMKFKRVTVEASKKDCDNRKRMTVSLVEEANVDEYLADYLLKPSFRWAETFCTLIGNKIRVYTGGDFTINKVTLTYYRLPKPIIFEGCRDWNDVALPDQELEFKDDLIELILDEAVKVAGADIGDFNNHSRAAGDVEANN